MELKSFYDSETVNYRRFAIKAAKELGYPKGVIKKIKDAEDDAEIAKIMKSARESGIHEEYKYKKNTNKVNGRYGRKWGPVKVKCVNNGRVYKSIADAGRDLDIARSEIVKCCKGDRKTAKGMKFEYLK